MQVPAFSPFPENFKRLPVQGLEDQSLFSTGLIKYNEIENRMETLATSTLNDAFHYKN